MSGVAGDPSESEPTPRQSPWTKLAATVVLLGPPLGWILLARYFGDDSRSPLFFGLAVATWIGCAVLVTLAVKRAGFRAMFAVLVTGVLFVGCQAAWLPGFYTRMRCGAWSLKTGTILRSYIIESQMDLEAGKEFPPTALSFFSRSELYDDLFGDFCSGHRLKDVKAGAFTLDDLHTGRVSEEQFVKEAAAHADRTQNWEQLGGVTLCKNPIAYRSKDAQVVLVIRVGGRIDTHRVGVGFADGHFDSYHQSTLTVSQLDSWTQSLAQLGIEPPQSLIAIRGGIMNRSPPPQTSSPPSPTR